MGDAENVWRRRSDKALLEAAQRLDEYTDEGHKVIHAELLRRGLPAGPAPAAAVSSGVDSVENLASLGDRLLGQIIDSAIALAPLVVSLIVFDGPTQIAQIAIVVSLIFLLFYLLFADGFPGGQSYGKRVVKTAVVDANSGEPCSFGQSFVRNLVLSVLGAIDWVFIFGRRRQRLGDRIAHTLVVYRQQ